MLSTGELDGRKVYVLKLQRGELPPATFYVDADTGDLLKSETIERAQGGVRIPVVSFYEDYREVHGMRIPFRVVARIESSDPSRTVIQYDTIEINVEVNDDIFTLSPPTEAFEGKALGGAPPPNLIFEGVGYTFGGYQTVDPGESTMGVFRLNGQPKRDGSIIVRSCKASQSPVYPIRDAILAVNHVSCPSLSSSGPRQWGESALKTSRLPGALSLLARSWLYPPSAWRRR